MKTLHLTLRWSPFDQISRGLKQVEFRDDKPYWRKRLFWAYPDKAKEFDEVHFRNGYGKHRPLLKVKWKHTGIAVSAGKILIFLGDIIP